MTPQIEVSLARLRTYLERIERDLTDDDRNQALANLAELAEIARRLWHNLEKQERIKKFVAESR